VSQAWINFARSGNPNHSGLPKWNKFDRTSKTTMVFDDHCVAKENFDAKQIALMKSFYPS
jgi:para-nitrobenzyl esterase